LWLITTAVQKVLSTDCGCSSSYTPTMQI